VTPLCQLRQQTHVKVNTEITHIAVVVSKRAPNEGGRVLARKYLSALIIFAKAKPSPAFLDQAIIGGSKHHTTGSRCLG
jgi:hypothetical protein